MPQWGPPPGRGGLSGLAWTGIGLGIAAFVALVAVLAFAVVHGIKNAPAVSAASCQEAIPPGASPQAASFLTDLNAGYVGWTQVSQSLVSEHDVVHLDDLVNTETTDQAFLAKVERIKFTGAALATGVAHQYIYAVSEYDSQLQTAISEYGYYAENHQEFITLDNSRSALAAQLRSALALPPARCNILRP
jgi:hypothetical protein